MLSMLEMWLPPAAGQSLGVLELRFPDREREGCSAPVPALVGDLGPSSAGKHVLLKLVAVWGSRPATREVSASHLPAVCPSAHLSVRPSIHIHQAPPGHQEGPVEPGLALKRAVVVSGVRWPGMDPSAAT